MLLPPSLEELIDESHPVRVVNQVIDSIDIKPLLAKYEGGGTSSYHPKMLLKVLVYGYLANIYSSRKLEASLKENVHMMWLSAMSRPDHNTINRFRSDRLKGVLKEVFSQVVLLLVESGHLDLKEVYTDGTKIEANANKYTFVWGKSIKTSKEKMVKQLEELWSYAESVAKEELESVSVDFEAIDAEKVEGTIKTINQALEGKSVKKEVKQKLTYAKKNWPAKLKEYEEKQAILAQRSSYSKTDPDATFMRMKEDHMRNGQLKPAYNLQISTQDQFITHYSLHQKTTDTTTFIPHFEAFKQQYRLLPKSITADAGYGSHENYQFLENERIAPYVKYNYFHKEQKKSKIDRINVVDKLHYNQEKDEYTCPMGQPMKCIGTHQEKSQTGFVKQIKRYQAQNCSLCPMNGACHKQKGNRVIQVNHKLNQLKIKAKENLLSAEGIRHRKKRPADVEAVFGNIKQNKNFKRFMLRGLEKVEIETGLIALAHNLAKVT